MEAPRKIVCCEKSDFYSDLRKIIPGHRLEWESTCRIIECTTLSVLTLKGEPREGGSKLGKQVVVEPAKSEHGER